MGLTREIHGNLNYTLPVHCSTISLLGVFGFGYTVKKKKLFSMR